MSPFFKKLLVVSALGSLFLISKPTQNLPIVAIANWGPHSSLDETIRGLKDELAHLGFKEGQNISFEIMDVNFEPSLIMQMLSKLQSSNPKVLVVLGTPIAQAAKGSIKQIPIVFADITDPVEAGLISHPDQAAQNLTGTSDKQDLNVLLLFVRKLLPHAQKIGILYATGEANDLALVKMMERAGRSIGMETLAVPIEHARDVPLRMQAFKGQVDAIYVGSSGPIQPSLPSIVAAADQMHIPVFNLNAEEVKNHRAFASFGVSYYQIGINTGFIVSQILKGGAPHDISPIYPKTKDHEAFISKKRADKLKISLPSDLRNVTIVE